MALEVKHRAEGNAVALLDGRVLLFTRNGRLTSAALDAIEELATSRARTATAHEPVGALAIVNGDAGLSDNWLLERQRELLRSLKATPHLSFAFCVVGESVQAIAMRAVVRVFVLGSTGMRMFTEPSSAAQWLAPRVGMEPGAILGALAELPH